MVSKVSQIATLYRPKIARFMVQVLRIGD